MPNTVWGWSGWADWLVSVGMPIFAAFNARAKPDLAAKTLGAWIGWNLLLIVAFWLYVGPAYSPSRLAIAVAIGVVGWIAYQVWSGKTWALVVAAALTLLLPLFEGDRGNTFIAVLDLICAVATVGAVVTIVQNRMDESREALASAQDAAE